MAGHKQLPPILSRVHPRRYTPYVAIALFGIIASALVARGSIDILADLYAFGAMISFTVAHVCVVALRFKMPDAERPWRTPINIPFRGRSIPVLAVIGGLGTATVWVVVVLTHATGRVVGISWMVVGVVMYVVYRRRQGFSLTETVTVVPLPEAVSTDILYDQMLVPIVGSRITDEMVVLACQLATQKQSAIDVMYVIEVPMNLPLDARLTTERARAGELLDAAQVIADQFDIEMRPVVVTARAAGKAIVAEATTRRSEVIILGTHRKRRIADRVFGGTVDYVLQHAPCEVLVNLVPREYPTEGFVESEAARSRVVHRPSEGGDGEASADEAPSEESDDAPSGAE